MCFPGPGCLQATQLASRILASGLLVHGSGQKNKRLKCSSVWHGGDCGPFFSLQVGRQTCRTHTCMHTHDICTHPHTQERTHAHITTAIVKGDLAEQHEPRLLQTTCLQASSPFSGTPQSQVSSVFWGIIYILPTLPSDLYIAALSLGMTAPPSWGQPSSLATQS